MSSVRSASKVSFWLLLHFVMGKQIYEGLWAHFEVADGSSGQAHAPKRSPTGVFGVERHK